MGAAQSPNVLTVTEMLGSGIQRPSSAMSVLSTQSGPPGLGQIRNNANLSLFSSNSQDRFGRAASMEPLRGSVFGTSNLPHRFGQSVAGQNSQNSGLCMGAAQPQDGLSSGMIGNDIQRPSSSLSMVSSQSGQPGSSYSKQNDGLTTEAMQAQNGLSSEMLGNDIERPSSSLSNFSSQSHQPGPSQGRQSNGLTEQSIQRLNRERLPIPRPRWDGHKRSGSVMSSSSLSGQAAPSSQSGQRLSKGTSGL